MSFLAKTALQTASSLLPDEQLRSSVFRILAESVEAAARHAPAGWGLTTSDSHIRLNVGKIEVFTITRSVVGVGIDRRLRERLPASLRGDVSEGYRSVPNAARAELDHDSFVRAYEHLRDAHQSLIEAAATTKSGRTAKFTWKTAHRPEMLRYVEEAIGRSLPSPRYAEDPAARPQRSAPRYWSIFADPDRYRIDDAVRAGGRTPPRLAADPWVTKGKPIRAGDRVLIWRGAGKQKAKRGVIALGEVLGDPEIVDDSDNPFWTGKEASGAPELRAPVRYQPLETPLLLEGPQHDLLAELSVARVRGGTVYEIEPALWERIVEAAGGWRPLPLPDEMIATLEAQLEPRRRRRGAGQGFGLSQDEKVAVESRAMEVATLHFADLGWEVDAEVAKTESSDLRCLKGAEELRVEVKGTTGLAERVILTANEVAHAREFPNLALVIVSEIALTRGEKPVATGGKKRVLDPWRIDEGSLEPMSFYYGVPKR